MKGRPGPTMMVDRMATPPVKPRRRLERALWFRPYDVSGANTLLAISSSAAKQRAITKKKKGGVVKVVGALLLRPKNCLN
uniref:Uncharacterized protein n=1 Tax=Oryza meridionalis TaxID=40149 RepID=A0A0E0DB04_9ORYZ